MTKEFYTVAQFCEAYGIGRTTFYAEVKAGRLRTVKIGAATRVRRTDADDWANSFPSQDDEVPYLASYIRDELERARGEGWNRATAEYGNYLDLPEMPELAVAIERGDRAGARQLLEIVARRIDCWLAHQVQQARFSRQAREPAVSSAP